MSANEIVKLPIDMRILILGHAFRRREELGRLFHLSRSLVLNLLFDLEVVKSKELGLGTLGL